jgi:hypothetical protein
VLVTDGGGIFRAKQARAVYGALGKAKYEIDRGTPWQSYIETHFNIQRRMADWHFAKAEGWAGLAEATSDSLRTTTPKVAGRTRTAKTVVARRRRCWASSRECDPNRAGHHSHKGCCQDRTGRSLPWPSSPGTNAASTAATRASPHPAAHPPSTVAGPEGQCRFRDLA